MSRSSPIALADAAAAEPASAGYLTLLGERVRDARARHGMTRRMLAQDSGVSERYLAQLEGGRGNFSIVLLKRVAAAIDVRIADLVSEAPASVEYELAVERLRRLAPAQLVEASALLAARFGLSAARMDRVALIGMRGAGKSTLGSLLAQRLNWQFVELSHEIETEAGVGVNEIFSLWGQAAYRRYERRATERLLRTRTRIVIAAGGGLVAELGTFEQLLDACYTVWLRAAPEDHWERVVRRAGDQRVRGGADDAHAMADMRRILGQREALYRKADAHLDTNGKTPAQSLRELLGMIRQARLSAPRATPRRRRTRKRA
jgi:XRE family transcriptional regulator, aerobic/anaerobic benzoate catabolism transcriptional regulator